MSSFSTRDLQGLQEAAKRFSRAQLTQPTTRANRLGNERLYRSLESLTPKQLSIHDSKAKRLALSCTRRAGKTFLAVPWLVELGMMAKNPETTMFFIAPTLEHAKSLLWRRFELVQKELGLEYEMKSDPWRIEFPTGAILYFRGAKDLNQLGSLRGFAAVMCWVDEVQDVPNEVLKEIQSAVGPSLRDLGGTMVFSGTPGRFCVGEWWEIATQQPGKDNWEKHEWSLFDNPHLPPEAKDLEAIMRDEGLTPDMPRFKREYMAQWVEDNTLQVYHYDIIKNGQWTPLANRRMSLPADSDWTYVMGVDFGYSPDPSAVTVVAYSRTNRTVHVVDEFKKKKISYTELYEQGIAPFLYKYGVMRVVGDAASPQAIAEINNRWGIGMTKCQKGNSKTTKASFIQLVNADMEKGYIQIPPESDLAREMVQLVWDPEKMPDRKEHPRRDNHLCDAFLYAWLECPNWYQEAKQTPANTFAHVGEREAHLFKQSARRNQNDKFDWADDSNFSANPRTSKLGEN